MTAAAPDVLELPEPIGLQPLWLDAPASRKVLRVGRRGSKTRFAMVAGIVGHGPGAPNDPMFPGILQGGDVLWVAVDYPQLSTVLWREELVPRFGDKSWATLNQQDHTLTIAGLGTLFLRSSEALRGVRGMGKKLCGVIIDEAAHFDLESALLNEVLPTLLDNGGWLIIMSTTNAGSDGNQDKRTPSFFNQICEAIRAEDPRFDGWKEFYGTAFDNPRISHDGINELIGLYPPESPSLEQEVYARLLKAGIGLALPKLTAERHIVPQFPVPPYWTQWGGFDWGFNHPWVFGWYACDTDGNVVKVDTIYGREQTPDEIVNTILSAAPAARRGFITYAGKDIFQDKGRSIGYKGPRIAEVFWSHGISATEADNSRVLGLDNLRRYIDWSPEWPADRTPRFTMMRTAGNLRCLAQMQSMQIDPDNLEDALKVDADAAGRGGDDGYDETRYGLMARPIAATMPLPAEREGQSLGYDYDARKPRVRMTADQEMAKMLGLGRRNILANRSFVPQRRR